MFRKLLGFFFSLLLLLLSSYSIRAADEFIIDSTVEYRIEESGKTHVRHIVSLENALSAIYAKQYSLTLQGIEIVNPQVLSNGAPMRFDLKKDADLTTFEIFFDTPAVGKGKSQTFELTYDNFSFAEKTGEVWEVSIPKIGDSNSFRNYTVKLIAPDFLGQEAYISPKPLQRLEEGSSRIFIFDKEKVVKTGVTAGFGQFQVFSFTLNYHLENPLAKGSRSEIALPPDTAFQKVHYQSISPAPKEVFLDEDGNWIGVFELSPRQKIDVIAQGAVQIFSDPLHFPRLNGDYLNKTLGESKYWQTSDPEIKSLARELKTAKGIYDYVSQHLTYDYERVKPNVARLGAKGALATPQSAICMEYTDLFVALARSAGISAREINGYAYTENPQIQPLSLVSDVLHSWAEYWDEGRGVWVPVDPTWASTTGGVDYFNKLDLRHFTFVIHGIDPERPYPAGSYKLGANPQKDVFVSFGELPAETDDSIVINVANQRPMIPFNSRLRVSIRNTGSVAHYNLTPLVSFDNEVHQTENIEVLPPYGTFEFDVAVPFSFLGRNTPQNILVTVAGEEISIPSLKSWVIIYNLLIIFIFAAAIVIFVLIRLKKINLHAIFTRKTHSPPSV